MYLLPMLQSVSFLSKKGGVGKTTLAFNCACSLSLSGQRVLLLDMDAQANLTHHLDAEKAKGLFEVLLKRSPIEESIQATRYERIDLLHGHPDLEDMPLLDPRLLREPNRLRQLLAIVKEQYDYILIDCPPAINWLTRMALFASDKVLVPVQAEPYALEGLRELVPYLDKMSSTAQLHRIVLNMHRAQTQLHQELAQEIETAYPGRVAKQRIRQTIHFAEAARKGLSLFEYAPASPGALDLFSLCWELFELSVEKVKPALEAEPDDIEEENKLNPSSVSAALDISDSDSDSNASLSETRKSTIESLEVKG